MYVSVDRLLKSRSVLIFLLGILLSSCGVYRQNIMFQTGGANLKEVVKVAEGNYRVQVGDKINLNVYSNDGELIIDPNFELRRDMGSAALSGRIEEPEYLVRPNGEVKLPLVGLLNIVGKTVPQVDSALSVEYGKFYVDAFVSTSISNRRVVVLGAGGLSSGQIVPLLNENMTLLEVIALSGGIPNTGKAHNIRLIRGDLTDPEIEVIDLSTVEGMQRASLNVQPNDVIYIEPIRKVVSEGIKDIAPVISLLTSFITLIVLINR